MSRDQVLFGRRLRAARVATGFDLSHFAEELGIPVQEYEKIEQGTQAPALDDLVYAARITGKSLDFLLTGADFRKD